MPRVSSKNFTRSKSLSPSPLFVRSFVRSQRERDSPFPLVSRPVNQIREGRLIIAKPARLFESSPFSPCKTEFQGMEQLFVAKLATGPISAISTAKAIQIPEKE